MGKWFIRQSTCCASRSAGVLDAWHACENLGVVAHTYNPNARKQILNGSVDTRDSLVFQSIHLVSSSALIIGAPPERLLCPWVGKGHRNEPLEMVPRNSVCFLACALLLIEWKPIQCDQLACYSGSLCGKAHKRSFGQCRLIRRAATGYSFHFRIQCSDF